MLSRFRPTLSSRERADFYRRLQGLSEAGIERAKAVGRALGRPGGRLATHLGPLRAAVTAGRPLAEGMEELPNQFSRFEIGLVRAGEEAGRLPIALGQLSTYFERRHGLVELATEAAAPPAIGLLLALFAFSVPNLLLEGVWGYAEATIVPLALVAAAVLGARHLAGRSPAGRTYAAAVHRLLLSLPVAGALVRDLGLAAFADGLASLWAAGVPATRSLELAAAASGNVALEERLLRAVPLVERGSALEPALEATGVLTPDLLDAIAVGEETGKLAEGLEKMAEVMRRQVEHRLRATLPSLLRLVLVTMVVFYVFYKLWTVVPLLTGRGGSYLEESILTRLTRVLDRLLK